LAEHRYWLDTNVFIDAKHGLYGFDLVPKFWTWLEDQMQENVICSSEMVYNELCASEGPKDDLHKWAKQRRKNGYWITPNRAVQEHYRTICTYVHGKYGASNPAKTGDFLAKADVWMIAHALEDQGTLVTGEIQVVPQSQTPKIPNVCKHFNVPFINMTSMLRTLRFRAE